MAKSALPLILGAAAAFLVLSKRNGGGGTAQGNIHIVEEGDSFESLIQDAVAFPGGERLAIVVSSFDAYGPSKVSEALLPYAQANPKIYFVVIAGPGLDAVASWFGDSSTGSADANKFGAFIADDVGEADKLQAGITAENAAAKLDELLKWSVDTQLTAEVSGGGLQGMRLNTSSTATPMSVNLGGFKSVTGTGTGTAPGSGLGLASGPVGLSPDVVNDAIHGALNLMFGA